jgi:hypothetical protein
VRIGDVKKKRGDEGNDAQGESARSKGRAGRSRPDPQPLRPLTNEESLNVHSPLAETCKLFWIYRPCSEVLLGFFHNAGGVLMARNQDLLPFVRSSMEWVAYFKQNAAELRAIPWELGAGVSETELASIAPSLRTWQLGETSDR